MPEYTIDKNIRHFLTDMGAYLSCFHHTVDDDQKAYLVLSAVKGYAKDILLGYAQEQIDTLEKIFHVLLREFKKCVVNLHQIKQDINEKEIIFSGKIRRYVRALEDNSKISRKFDRICIDYLKVGALSHIQNRLYQRSPCTFQQAVKVAIEAETEKHAKPKTKINESPDQIAATKVSAIT